MLSQEKWEPHTLGVGSSPVLQMSRALRGTNVGCTVLLERVCSVEPATDTGGGMGAGAPLPTQWESALSLVHILGVGTGG